jgi:hypothetical protein
MEIGKARSMNGLYSFSYEVKNRVSAVAEALRFRASSGWPLSTS